MSGARPVEARLDKVSACAYTVPTDAPEGDGTLDWHETTLVLAEIKAGNAVGIGYSFTSAVAAKLVEGRLAGVVQGRDALDVPGAHLAMLPQVRNPGRPGIAATTVAAERHRRSTAACNRTAPAPASAWSSSAPTPGVTRSPDFVLEAVMNWQGWR